MLADFFDVDALAEQALRVLKDPGAMRPLGQAARALVEEQYSLDRTFPKLWDFFARATANSAPKISFDKFAKKH